MSEYDGMRDSDLAILLAIAASEDAYPRDRVFPGLTTAEIARSAGGALTSRAVSEALRSWRMHGLTESRLHMPDGRQRLRTSRRTAHYRLTRAGRAVVDEHDPGDWYDGGEGR